jgi:hypothetical protein
MKKTQASLPSRATLCASLEAPTPPTALAIIELLMGLVCSELKRFSTSALILKQDSTLKNITIMAPFIPGDYVTWAGVSNGPEILVYTLVAENVQTTKADSGDPLYVCVEDVSTSFGICLSDSHSDLMDLGDLEIRWIH